MFAKPWVSRWKRHALGAGGEEARGRLGWRALVPLVMFVVCVMGGNEPPQEGGLPPIPDDPPCPVYDASTFPAPNVAIAPSEVGTIDGSFAVSQTGEATYTMPLVVPPGRAGMAPQLAISYSANAGQGIVGVGFGLKGFSAVTRCPKNLADDGVIQAVLYDEDDHFCLDGARLVQTATSAGIVEYRTFPDTFRKVLAHYPAGWARNQGPQSFDVFTKAGHVIRYGGTLDSRPLADSGVVASWWISQEEDRRYNTVEYAYHNELHTDGYTTEHYPTEIRYTRNGTAPPTRAVRFAYGDSTRHRTFYSRGMQFQHSKLLASVSMLGPGDEEVRRYQLQYTGFSGTMRPLLEMVRECSMGVCKPPTQFTWSSHKQGPLTRVSTLAPSTPDPTTVEPRKQMPWILADVTGDGLDDIVTSGLNYVDSHGYSEAFRSFPNSGLSSVFASSGGTGGVDLASATYIDPHIGVMPWSGTPFDYDMDGRKDLFLDTGNTSTPTWQVLHSLPNGYFEVLDTGIAHASQKKDGRVGVVLADVNGDGAADLITCDNPSYESDDPSVPTNEDARWTVRFGVPSGPAFDSIAHPISILDGQRCDSKVKIVDVDADGKLDLLMPERSVLGPSWCTSAEPCTYWALSYLQSNQWSLQDTRVRVSGSEVFVFPDVNGDGLPDAVALHSDYISPVVYMNTGLGFSPPIIDVSFTQLPDGYRWGSYVAAAQLIDYNGDGAVDILMPMQFHCDTLVPAAACWVVLQASHSELGTFTIKDTNIPFALDQTQGELANMIYHGSRRFRPIQVADVDGDGRHDIVVPEQDYFAVYKNDGPQDLLTAVTNGVNPLEPTDPGFMPTVSIEYANLVDYARTLNTPEASLLYENTTYMPRADASDDCAFPRTCVVGARRVVSKYRFNNGANQARTFSIRYRDGRVDHLGRGFLGFGTRIVTDENTQAGSVEIYDNKTYDPTFATYPYVGHAVRTWSWTPGMLGQVELAYGNTRYDVVPTNAGLTYFTLGTMQRVEREEGTFTPFGSNTYLSYTRDTETTPATVLSESWHIVSNYDEYGNILGELDLTDNVDLTTSTQRVYTNDPATWLIGQLDSEDVRSTALGEMQRRKSETLLRNQYGEVVLSQAGDPSDPQTKLWVWSGRDNYGNLVLAAADDAYGHHRSMCVSYDPENLFPYATRNGVGHTSYTQFDRARGVVTAIVDANGLLTQRSYDGFGRMIEELAPDGAATKIAIDRNKWGGPQSDWWVTQTRVTSKEHGEQTTEYDSLGREVLTWTRAPQVGVSDAYGSFDSLTPWYIYHEKQYDSLGRVSKVSLPWKTSDPASSRLYHELTYDGAGRIAEHKTPWNSTTTYAYGKNVTAVTDSAGTAFSQVDEMGRTTLVTDKNGKTTSYVYGPFSGVRSINNVGQVTTTRRDAYGRVRQSYDPDRHATITDYDGFGEVTKTVDALGRQFEYEYDAIGRLVQRHDPQNATTWEYDSKPNGLGRIGRVTSPFNHVKNYSYDKLSRLEEVTLTIGAETFPASFEYDDYGRLSTITYPPAGDDAPLVVSREYDHFGHLLRVYDDTTGHDFWQLDYIDKAGRPVLEKFGNGTFTHHAYFQAQGAVRGIQTGLGPAMYQDLRYTYDDRLNVESRTDAMQAMGGIATGEVFKYDALDRLTCAGFVDMPLSGGPSKPPEPSHCALSIAYAGNGNIEHKSDVGGYKYHSAHPHAVETAGADFFAYDEVGNQIARPGATIAYTPFDLPSRITRTDDGTVIDFAYDGDQQRIRKTTSKADTIYFEGLYERVTDSDGGEKHRYYVSVGSATLVLTRAKAQDDELSYIHPDTLGSPDVVTDAKGNLVEQHSYDAFGARRNPKWGQPPNLPYLKGVNMGYTGHEPDDEVGLVNARGRIYDPRVARFLQTDPIVGRPGFSQSWNAYSYVLNNPMKFVDPTGFDGEPPTVPETGTDPGMVMPPLFVEPSAEFWESLRKGPQAQIYAGLPVEAPNPSSPVPSVGIDGTAGNHAASHGLSRIGELARRPSTLPYDIAPDPKPSDYLAGAKSLMERVAITVLQGVAVWQAPLAGAHYGVGASPIVETLEQAKPTPASPAQAEAEQHLEMMAMAVVPSGGGAGATLGRHAAQGGGFMRGITAGEISAINRNFGGMTTLAGHPSSAIAAAARQVGFYNKAAAVVLEIAGHHTFDNGNKRTAHAVYNLLRERNGITTGVSNDEVRRILIQVATGELRSIEAIAKALRGF